MTKTEKALRKAFSNHEPISRSNTVVTIDGDRRQLIVHGNVIAKLHQGNIWINDCGLRTRLTLARLRNVVNLPITVRQNRWFVHGREIPYNQWHMV